MDTPAPEQEPEEEWFCGRGHGDLEGEDDRPGCEDCLDSGHCADPRAIWPGSPSGGAVGAGTVYPRRDRWVLDDAASGYGPAQPENSGPGPVRPARTDRVRSLDQLPPQPDREMEDADPPGPLSASHEITVPGEDFPSEPRLDLELDSLSDEQADVRFGAGFGDEHVAGSGVELDAGQSYELEALAGPDPVFGAFWDEPDPDCSGPPTADIGGPGLGPGLELRQPGLPHLDPLDHLGDGDPGFP